jgi:diguanylate cyclase (GGDEF)-like protein
MSLLRERQDSLSGLLSRSAFERIIDEALVAARNRGSLLYIDVDELKSINESFGYPVGDEVIRRIAQLITRAMTDFEIACRVAGDRFVVYTPERNPEEALSLGEELATSASSLGYECDGQTVPVGLSVGAAPPPPAGLGSRHWIAAAELACQQSRERTRQSL